MTFAHTLGAGGPEIEVLMLGAGLVILGVMLFFQESVKRVVPVLLLVGGVALGAGSFAIGGTPQTATAAAPPGASVEFISPKQGATVPADEPVALEIEASGVTLASDAGDTSGSHIHIYVDGRLAAMVYTDNPEIQLAPGDHVLTVELSDANHASYRPPIEAQVEVTAQ